MTSDLDVFRAANAVIKQHGTDAPIHAAMRADALLEAGDLEGQRVWPRIIAAIEELTSTDRPEGSTVH